MELKEFSEKFLLHYKEKRKRKPNLTDEQFWILFFDEALQNFADRICKEQRKLYADLYNEEIGYKQPDNFIYNRILEYKQPKIEEL
jgi:hypothetical protein